MRALLHRLVAGTAALIVVAGGLVAVGVDPAVAFPSASAPLNPGVTFTVEPSATSFLTTDSVTVTSVITGCAGSPDGFLYYLPGPATPNAGFPNIVIDAGANTTTGSVTFSPGSLPVGTYEVMAYTRSSCINDETPVHYDFSWAGGSSFTVSEPTSATIAGPTTAVYGETPTYDTTVVSPAGIPSGTVQLTADGGASGAAAGLDGAGVAANVSAVLGVGNHTVAADFTGNTGWSNSSSSNTVSLDVTQASTTVTATASTTDDTATITADVATEFGTAPTGNVIVEQNGSTVATGAVSSTGTGGQAVIPVPFSPGDDYTVTYTGDANHAASDPFAIAPTGGALDLNPALPVAGEPTDITASLLPINATGTVSFSVDDSNGVRQLGIAPIVSGAASLDGATFVEGPQTVTAFYAGDGTHGPSTINADIFVPLASAQLSLTTDPVNPTAADSITLAAHLDPAWATGTVTFFDGDGPGSVELGTAPVVAHVASLPGVTLAAGDHEIVMEYSGDANVCGCADIADLTVAPAPSAPSAAIGSGDSVAAGSLVHVSGSGWDPGSDVTVTLHSDPVVLGTVTASSTGTFAASFVVPAGTPVGAHELVISGTGSTGPATVTLGLTVTAATPAGTLAYTGVTDITPLTFLGLVLLIAGALVLFGRRRLRHDAAVAGRFATAAVRTSVREPRSELGARAGGHGVWHPIAWLPGGAADDPSGSPPLPD